jgi:putative transposase
VHDSRSSSRIMRRLTTLFPSEFLEEHAEELGVVEREGKLQIPVLEGVIERLPHQRAG